ncbi:unnamed protein product [Cylicostephanus goldi]|uniref:Uncharacterized protein n=1 Tax=Cylicostephanus goldi TaxID=71465 RepID=A0A3P7QDG8_CYLGO|nr:unnamed protein product [Cylicostephanus goldi]
MSSSTLVSLLVVASSLDLSSACFASGVCGGGGGCAPPPPPVCGGGKSTPYS